MKLTIDIPQAEVNKMLRGVRAWQARKRSQIIDLIEETTKAIAKDARDRVSIQSGKLKKSIKTILNHVATDLGGYVVADEFYAKFIELGTASARAHPFMLPAYEVGIQTFLVKLRIILSS